MSSKNQIKTIIRDSDSNLISTKLAAVNNNVRFSILEILKDFQKNNMNGDNSFKADPLYSREINTLLINNYNISITTQMLGQHLKQLLKADLIEELIVKKEVPNKIGKRNVKAYVLKKDAFQDLFFEVSFLSEELLSFFDLYKVNQHLNDDKHCVLTIFNGVDKGKTFKIHKNELVLIGRKDNFNPNDLTSFTIPLDNSYTTVSNVSKPHLKLFYKNNEWCILDEASSNGTFIGDKKVTIGKITKLKNNSFLKLSKGIGAAIIYCSF
ncbi:FHA domain-containing protein [Methanobrevibacter olleyae]|uniref:FHA domain-containing protein n=1 Tax=Methanobrevibacter olleyae TaxID=294671 RepID=A0A126QYN1_METOL|nr:FHA domain-containing protein [Methanobrevibacter olleyae]AMK14928.1 FHA domain-containing protein [Methanobrevibacter olleyae]